MKITKELLVKHHACADQIEIFCSLWPEGCDPTLKNLQLAQQANLDVFWCINFLPYEGMNSKRAFTFWCVERCVEQVQHLCKDDVELDTATEVAAWVTARANQLEKLSEMLCQQKD
jgi:hypothetical protein